MRISRIKVKNFRNFRDLDVQVGEHAVIVGENKVGKSNLVHALRLVLDPSLPERARRLTAGDIWDGAGIAPDEPVIIKVFLRDFEDDLNQLALLATSLVSIDPMEACLSFECCPTADDDEGPYEYVWYGGDDDNARTSRSTRNRLPMDYLHALRNTEDDLRASHRSPLRPLLRRLTEEVGTDVLEAAEEELRTGVAVITDMDAVTKLAEDLNKRMVGLVGAQQAVELGFDLASADPSKLLQSLNLFIDGGIRQVSEASLGTANLLYLLLRLKEIDAQRDVGERDHTFLAVEEPEAHLHPHVQRLVYRSILRDGDAGGASLVLTTHSTFVTSVAPLRSLIVLRSAGNRSVGFSAASLDLAENEVADLERYLDVTRSELLFARGVVLVEGEAEKFLMPSLAAICGIDLDGLGITVASVAGTHFGSYAALLTSLDVPFSVLSDYDPRTTGDPRIASRYRKLLRDYLDEDDPGAEVDEVLAAARAKGLFTNESTFELALKDDGWAEAIFETIRDHSTNGAARTRAKAWLVDPDTCDDARLLKDIDAIGKGRFAQLVSAHDPGSCPTYIRDALAFVAERA